MSSEPAPPPGATSSSRPGGYGVRWHLVLPVKEVSLAKSRLAPTAPLSRPDLARAVARDTLEAVCAALDPAQLVVVTSDEQARRAAEDRGAHVVPDPGRGLNAAITAGWRADVHRDEARPDGDGPSHGWAALLGDLPAVRPADLREALAACAAYPSAVVPDAEGTGTVLLTGTVGEPLPLFGPGSAERHAAAGAVRLELDLPRLRQDVDTWADLETALELGVGRHTAAALAAAAQDGRA